MFMMHTFCRSELMYSYKVYRLQNVYKMYSQKVFVCKTNTTFRQTFLLHKFCIQNLAGINLLILYTKCIATKVCPNVVYISYTFCILQLYTSCAIFLYGMYTQFPCGESLCTCKVQRDCQIYEHRSPTCPGIPNHSYSSSNHFQQ